jgi:hypothetical protein
MTNSLPPDSKAGAVEAETAAAMVIMDRTNNAAEVRKSGNAGMRRMEILLLLLRKDRGNPPSARDGKTRGH